MAECRTASQHLLRKFHSHSLANAPTQRFRNTTGLYSTHTQRNKHTKTDRIRTRTESCLCVRACWLRWCIFAVASSVQFSPPQAFVIRISSSSSVNSVAHTKCHSVCNRADTPPDKYAIRIIIISSHGRTRRT